MKEPALATVEGRGDPTVTQSIVTEAVVNTEVATNKATARRAFMVQMDAWKSLVSVTVGGEADRGVWIRQESGG